MTGPAFEIDGLMLTATADGMVIDAIGGQGGGLIPVEQARELALWILAALPPQDDTGGRHCTACAHATGAYPSIWCGHPAGMRVCPVAGVPLPATAHGMRMAGRACGPRGNLWAERKA